MQSAWLYIPDAVSTSGTVDLNLSSVRSKALGGVFCGDTALEGKAASRDVVLSQAKLLKRCTSSNLNLRSNDIDAGNLLGNGVLDLNTWVDPGKS